MTADQARAVVNLVPGTIERLADRLAKIRAMSDDEILRPVDFFGQTAPAFTWLMLMNNHSVHHRGQLAAYLRAAGSRVPAIYGMSADESAFA